MPEEVDHYSCQLERIYRNRFDADEEYRDRLWRILVRDWFQRFIPSNASVLDLGCGYGQFINNVICARKFAMDLNLAAKDRLKADVNFFAQDCAITWNLPDASLDVVFTSNFFEHLLSKADLTRTISEAQRCLKHGGKIIAMGPNIKFVRGAYWDFYDHHLPLTEMSLSEAFQTSGLHVETVLDRFLPYTIVNAPKYPAVFLRVYLLVPFLWKWMGKQFMVIASK